MLVKTKGIILRSLKYGETSLILDIYTQDYGLNSYIIGGVRNKKSKTQAGLCQIMSLVEVVAYHKNTKGLFRIKEIASSHLYQRIPFEIRRSSVGMFMTEILKNTIKEDEENTSLFEFIYYWFLHLDLSSESVSNVHLLFMIELAEQIGIQPRDNFSINNPYFDLMAGQFVSKLPDHHQFLDADQSEWLYDLMMQERNYVHELKLTNTQRRILLDKLILFYKLHIESIKELHTYSILNEILS
ncbi:DNA repair protein RecO [Portibacter lacus]|uniref:DNA repair protein RecO n=1 Tax=Portibacter lacus TaxID=1099794 RepID=A0AA37SQR3_9BACT|nr:DNA repair protein RecO [Portibacter lacus]GLR18055.1 DNA repair protein RecO [Portibacter lacus]